MNHIRRPVSLVMLCTLLPACAGGNHQAFQNTMAIIAAGLAGSKGANHTNPQVAEAECSSDFECSNEVYGAVCVKRHLSYTGECMMPTLANGLPAPQTPRNTVNVRGDASTGCHQDYDCPVTFRCDLSTGACVR